MPGVLSRLPDITATGQLSVSAESGVGTLVSRLGSMMPDNPDSPLAAITNVLGGLDQRLNIDMNGLSGGLSGTLTTVRNAVPAAGVDVTTSLGAAFGDAGQFLGNLPIVREIPAGGNLQDTALAVIHAALDSFTSRQQDLAGNLVDPDLLQSVRDTATAIENFQSDFAAHQNDFLPFLAKNLTGMAPDLLREPLERVRSLNVVFDRVSAQTIDTALGPARDALGSLFHDLTNAIQSIDPNDAAGYTTIQGALNALETAVRALGDAVTPVLEDIRGVWESEITGTLFSTLESLLRGVTFIAPRTTLDIVGPLRDLVNELLTKLHTMLHPTDVAARIDNISKTIRDTFTNSPLGQLRQTIHDFLDRIRQAIESVPTEQIQQTVEGMLAQVRTQVENLHLDEAGARIEQALHDAETFITDNLNTALRDQVGGAVRGLLENLRSLPIQDLGRTLTQAITQLQGLINELEESLRQGLDELSSLLDELDKLSFKPVGDAVIGEIDALKAKLQAINPDALSDVEKIALKAALAILQQIDLEGTIINALKQGFREAGGALKRLVDDLAAVLGRLKDQLAQYDPEKLLSGLSGLLDRAVQAVGQLNARSLMAPLYSQVDQMQARLAELAPGRLLDPLQGPFDQMRSAVNQLDPAQWLAPLNDLYAEIDKLIGFVDVTPLLTELDRRQRDLLSSIRSGLLSAIDQLHLPEPLSGLTDALRPVLEAITDTLFAAPDEAVPNINTVLHGRISLATLFEPVDALFDRLIGMIQSVPQQALTDAMNVIRESLGIAVDVLDPGRILNQLRSLQNRLDELSPDLLFSMPNALPALRATFELRVEGAAADRQSDIQATLARFDAAISVTLSADPNALLPQLRALHASLKQLLRDRLRGLDATRAEAAYGRLRGSIERILPDFLRSPQVLTYTDIITGLQALKPSRQLKPVEDVLNQFLADLEPMQAAIEPSVNGFFRSLRDVISLLNPLSVKDSVAAIYDAIRAKVRILDPVALADSIRTAVFDPVRNLIGQLDPAALKQKLDAAFQRVVAALTNNVKAILDDIANAIDEQLRALRTLIADLARQIKETVQSVLGNVQELIQRVEHLVFVEILDRLRRLIDNLEGSFDRELDRVRNAFDAMLAAIPLGGSQASASAGASI